MMWLMKGITLLSRHVGEGNITLMIVLKNFWLADISPELAKFLPMYFQEAIPSISILCITEPANISGSIKNSFKSSNSSDLKQDLAISGFDFEPLAWISNPLLMSISQRNIWASFLSAVIQICLSQIIFQLHPTNYIHARSLFLLSRQIKTENRKVRYDSKTIGIWSSCKALSSSTKLHTKSGL